MGGIEMRAALSLGLLFATVASASAQPASAQPAPVEPPPAVPRDGLFLGAGLWGGNISCNGSSCGGFRVAGGGSGHIGWMFTPRLGVLFDFWAMTSSKNDVSVTFLSSTLDVRYWVAPILWIQGGIGDGHALIHAGALAKTGDDVPVGEVAAGVEVVRGRNWDLDVALQIDQGTSTNAQGGATTGRSTGLGAHFTLYTGR